MVLRLVGDGVCELLGGRGGDERHFPLAGCWGFPQHSLPPFLHHGLKWGGGQDFRSAPPVKPTRCYIVALAYRQDDRELEDKCKLVSLSFGW